MKNVLVKLTKIFLLGVLALVPFNAGYAQEICPLNGQPLQPKGVSVEGMRYLPILDGGRVKPLDTYARALLLRFSGKSTFDKKPAILWLARLLFAPESTREDAIFLINNPAIPESLGIQPEKHRRYSFNQLELQLVRLQDLAQKAEAIDAKKRDTVESEIIRLYENLRTFSLLSLNLSFTFPHPDFTISDSHTLNNLELPDDVIQFSFLDIALRAQSLYRLTEPLEKIHPDSWNDSQKELMGLVNSLFQWAGLYQDLPLAIVPSYTAKAQETLWLSPWDAMMQGLTLKEGRNEISLLRDMTLAFWQGRQVEFDLAARNFQQSTLQRVAEGQNILRKTKLEIFYNNLQPFFYSKVLYLLVLLLLFCFLGGRWTMLYRASLGLIWGAFGLHVLGMILRIIILSRPPVSTLYETFVFVSLVCAVTGILIEYFQRRGIGVFIAALAGFVFLTIAGKFNSEGDTMQMLVAVLNSNFWLSTHVLTITMGYAGAVVAGIIGHIYIVQLISKPRDKEQLESTYKILLGTMGFGLTMTFLGTNLGGIWADQSWGRFWGWDPKENGALLIILWIAMLFHAKIAKIIGRLGMAAGNALGIMVVMWAWFGVNLLSIGLHSYGFTSGLARNLIIYAVIQVVFILIAVPIAVRKERESK